MGDDGRRDSRCRRPPLRTWVNGELRQDSSTSDLIFSCQELVEFIAQTCTLMPGDLILTGTPSGVGMGFDPPRFLQPGDVGAYRDRESRCDRARGRIKSRTGVWPCRGRRDHAETASQRDRLRDPRRSTSSSSSASGSSPDWRSRPTSTSSSPAAHCPPGSPGWRSSPRTSARWRSSARPPTAPSTASPPSTTTGSGPFPRWSSWAW